MSKIRRRRASCLELPSQSSLSCFQIFENLPHIQSRGSRHFITWVKVRSSVAEHVQHVATRAHTSKNARVKCSALFARSGRYCGEKNKQRVVLFVFQFDFVGKKRMTRTSSRQFVDYRHLQRSVPEWWCIFRRACLPYMVNLK